VTTEKNVVMQQFDVPDAWVCISGSTFARIILSLGNNSAYFMKRSEVFLIRHSHSLTVWHHIPKRYKIASEVWKNTYYETFIKFLQNWSSQVVKQ